MAALQGTMSEETDDIHTEVRTRLKEEEIYNLIHNFYYYFLEGLATCRLKFSVGCNNIKLYDINIIS